MPEIDLDHLKTWEGNQETQEDDITLFPARALAAALDHDRLPEKGDELPTFWEWLYFLPTPKASATGADGHPSKGGFLPPVPLPRRMWAAGEAEIHKPLIIGEPASRTSTILSVDLKQGSTGTLVFVNVKHDISQKGSLCISQIQNIVYREQPAEAAPLPRGKEPSVSPLWSKTIKADPVLLFRFSALTYNGHRIHYDRPYSTDEELYPALVVHGPLLVTLLLDLKQSRAPDQTIRKFTFRALRPTFDVNPFQVQGVLEGKNLQLWSVDNENALCMKLDAEIA
ncbi:MAG: acyl-CoA dehydrogenase [Proteobacteria bacterium]|nr:MAG: acyl-CoA dehydrogenase [Pseudomonadota bacterium]PIE40248.1 MAG: acyl-CoA dehydrogenase [Gammaproteobacteria bacterium]